ncbi:MAG: Unknown protein [uncultured Sulfurovum sp.]|uniref:Periplasmic protein n=1 Tax=uncultured Sulfurovum sp. TaxID=269237 RepID=A0A6S6SB91_9BACT|nr:MAG: Unknown protein [uncultured Sulfurovum sp.]
MKNLFISTLLLLSINVAQAETNSDIEICKTYINKATTYQSTMKSDPISQATFAFYKDEVVSHCGSIVAKIPFDKNFFVNNLMKTDTKNVENCKLSIKMAKASVEDGNISPFSVHAHKINIIDNCGTLVAKKAPTFCLFDIVDNSKEDLKNRCIASIQKAHADTNPKTLQMHKEDIVANCGKLHSTL